MGKKSTPFFDGIRYGIVHRKAIEFSSSIKEIRFHRRDWDVVNVKYFSHFSVIWK